VAGTSALDDEPAEMVFLWRSWLIKLDTHRRSASLSSVQAVRR
jgi:hypothetical protein